MVKMIMRFCACVVLFVVIHTGLAESVIVNHGGGADYTTIQSAIQNSSAGDVITVMPGIYAESIDLLGKAVTLISSDPNLPEAAIIDAGGSSRAILCQSGESPQTTINGFTIQNGFAVDGGGLLCSASSPTIKNCVFRDNSATYGGAVKAVQSNAAFTGCAFISNTSTTGGGAVRLDDYCSVVFSDCVFQQNASHDGGAVESRLSTVRIENSPFDQNDAANGAGMYIWRSEIDIINCPISNHDATDYGGGIFIVESNARIDGSVFESNTASFEGGGMFCLLGTDIDIRNCVFNENAAASGGALSIINNCKLLLANTVFVDNSASGTGGGIRSRIDSDLVFVNCILNGNQAGSGSAVSLDQGRFEMTNCTVRANTSDDQSCIVLSNCPEQPSLTHCVFWDNGLNTIQANGCNPNIRFCCVEGGYAGEGNIDDDPLFANPSGPDTIDGTIDDNLQLRIDSPCIDAGNNYLLPTDFADLDDDGRLGDEPLPIDAALNTRQIDVPQVIDSGYSYFPGAAVVDMGAYEYQVPSPIEGDLDHDGDVDIADFSIFSENWLTGV